MKKRVFLRITILITVFTFSIIGCFNIEKKENDPSIAEQASNAGYTIPEAPERGVASFNLLSSQSKSIISSSNRKPGVSAVKKYGEQNAVTRSAAGTTTEGAVVYTYTLSNDINGIATIQVWRNGQYSPEMPATIGDESAGEIALQPGQNFVCIVVLVDGEIYGRSSILLVNSQVEASHYRFEMTWDNLGDVDLHLDTTDDLLHVYYADEYQNANGYLAELDIDNVYGYGPENIRVFSTPESIATMRVFVDYFYAAVDVPVNVTVRIYKNEQLVDTKSIVLNLTDVNSASVYGSHSKLVDLSSIK